MAKNVPFNLEAEQSVLGSVLIDNNILRTIADELSVIDFYDLKNQLLFQSMKNLDNSGLKIDFTTLNSDLQSRNKLEEAGGYAYLNNILNSVFTTANIEDYIAIIKDASLKRNVIAAANSIVEAGYDSNYTSTDYIDYAERLIFDLAKRRKADAFTPIAQVIDNVNEITLANRNRTETMTGISTGYENLDGLTLGLQDNNLIILAARPAMGKSAFAMNVAINAARFNDRKFNTPLPVAIFSLEMSQEQLVQRIIAAEGQVHISNILSGKMSALELKFFETANEKLKRLNVHFSDQPGITVADIRARCRKLKQEEGLGLVIIDYLQLISGSGKVSRQEEVSDISRSLKLMARELEVPVIALSQLSRKVEERPDKRPMMSDLRESGSIEQDADLIFFLYRAAVYNLPNSEPGVTELIVGKNRAGRSGHSLRYLFKGENVLFSELPDEEGDNND
ncbi:MAG: replicative DNA helicase [bacterium]